MPSHSTACRPQQPPRLPRPLALFRSTQRTAALPRLSHARLRCTPACPLSSPSAAILHKFALPLSSTFRLPSRLFSLHTLFLFSRPPLLLQTPPPLGPSLAPHLPLTLVPWCRHTRDPPSLPPRDPAFTQLLRTCCLVSAQVRSPPLSLLTRGPRILALLTVTPPPLALSLWPHLPPPSRNRSRPISILAHAPSPVLSARLPGPFFPFLAHTRRCCTLLASANSWATFHPSSLCTLALPTCTGAARPFPSPGPLCTRVPFPVFPPLLDPPSLQHGCSLPHADPGAWDF